MKNDILCPVSKPGEEERYIHPLDNVSGGSNDIMELRRLITTIVRKRFTQCKYQRLPCYFTSSCA